MINQKKSAFTRASVLGFLALGLTTLSLTGCFDSGTDSKDPNLCGDDGSLCVPRAALRDTGEAMYQEHCAGCHGGEGQGERGPQIANSSFIMDNRVLAIQLILRGNYATPPTADSFYVNGVLYTSGGMPPWKDILSDHQVAGLLTFIRSVWNDTLVTNCNPDSLDVNGNAFCDRAARDPAVMDLDTVAVWEVKAIRDTLPPGE